MDAPENHTSDIVTNLLSQIPSYLLGRAVDDEFLGCFASFIIIALIRIEKHNGTFEFDEAQRWIRMITTHFSGHRYNFDELRSPFESFQCPNRTLITYDSHIGWQLVRFTANTAVYTDFGDLALLLVIITLMCAG